MSLAQSSQSSYQPADLVTGEKQIITQPVTVASGQTLVALSVMGIVTATGKAVLSTAAASDGSQVPDHILVHAVDTTAGEQSAPAYQEGCFNPTLLTYGAGHDAASVAQALRQRGLYLRKPG